MSQSVLTLEQLETIQKVERRIHQVLCLQMELLIRLKKHQYMSVIRTCVFKFNYWKYHRCEENGYSYEWHPGQPSYLIKNVRNIECTTGNHIPLVVPGVQAPEHQTKILDDQKQGQPRATCRSEIT